MTAVCNAIDEKISNTDALTTACLMYLNWRVGLELPDLYDMDVRTVTEFFMIQRACAHYLPGSLTRS